MLIFNLLGLAMMAGGFGAAYLVGLLVHRTDEPFLMLVCGPLLIVVDGIWRNRKAGEGQSRLVWFHHRYGGMFAFLPIWVLALAWMGLGTYRLLTGSN